ncbi:MAG: sacsin N-terminal ATP-binding-like domain-containing protein, partial [Trebonia sp.]
MKEGRIHAVQASLSDPFGTEELRRRVLDVWAASPARFREDANAEEDYALGGYRDRVVVELAQNAADAAARGGVAGRLRLIFRAGTLVAANTGAPLDAAGVAALSTLRASSKRGPDAHETAVGRFGVGFAAAIAVSDEPRISSITGAVSWSRSAAGDLVRRIPELAAELAARSGHLPVLRLPFPADGAPPEGFATAVTLLLRDETAGRLVKRLLAETGPALLLALPALATIEIEVDGATRTFTAVHDGDGVTITVDGAASRWRTATAGGRADPRLLAGRPAEERARPSWSVRWAVPVTLGGENGDAPAGRLPAGVSAVVHAPTPTGEPLGLPALLLASFPLSPDRRHVAPCPLTDFILDQAAEVYARLLPSLAPGAGLLDLVPSPVAQGELDAQLRRAILGRLQEIAFLPAAERPGPRVRPRDAVILDATVPGLAGCLAPVLPGLVTGPARHPAYALLGVQRLRLAELADTLGSLDRDPAWWRRLYDALAAAEPGELGELGALPVPLADGRLVRGPRGLLLPGPDPEGPGRLALLGLRVVHPGAVHPLLARLGAVEATPRGVLADPAVRAAVAASYDEEDPGPVADAVLSLVAAAHLRPGERPWLADLALPGADGEWYAAGELLLPGGPLAEVVAADTPFGTVCPAILERYDAATLEAAGVLSSFGLLVARDVALDAPDLDLDGAHEWADDIRARLPGGDVPPVAAEVLAVRDLELVDPARWPRALELLAAPSLRAGLVEPTRVLLADGRHANVPSYTAWWLRRHPVLGGHRPADLRVPGSDPLLAGLYDENTLPTDPAVARALGVRTSLAGLLAEPGGADEVLDRLADPGRQVTRAQLRALWAALAAVAGAAPPDRVRVVCGDEVVVADAGDALVLDAADLWPFVAAQPLVLAPYDRALRLADLLDLPLVSEEVAGRIESSPVCRQVPAIARAVLPEAPTTYYAHDRLVVDGVAVPWRYTSGAVHAAGPGGLACGLAWASGRWPARHLLAAL